MKKYIAIFSVVLIFVVVLVVKNATSKNYTTGEVFISDTFLVMTIETTPKVYEALTNEIIREIKRSDTVLNTYNDNSEVSTLNSLIISGITNIEISSELANLLNIGLRYSEYSNGAYDITTHELIKLWGFGVREPFVPTALAISNVLENIGYQYVSIKTNHANQTNAYSVVVEKPVGFDFGSYGKGYILNNIKSILSKYDIENYLINYGGNIILLGVNSKGLEWTVGIQSPRDYYNDEYPVIIQSTNASIVTSGDYQRFFIENGIRYHHIFDATTGYPAYNSISATIVANVDNATEGDLFSTMAFMMGTNFFDFFDRDEFMYKEAYIMLEEDGELFIYTNTK